MCNFCKVRCCYSLFLQQFRHKNLTNMRKRNISTSSYGSTPTEYCMDSVKKYDYENYLSTLLLPTPARSSMFAVRAFNIEIAQIQDLASNYKIAEMRMHFWTDSLDLIYKEKPPQTPVALALTRVTMEILLCNVNTKPGLFLKFAIAYSYGGEKAWAIEDMAFSTDRIPGGAGHNGPAGVFYGFKRKEPPDEFPSEQIVLHYGNSELANVTKQTPFGNIEALVDYAEKSVSSVYYLTLQCLGQLPFGRNSKGGKKAYFDAQRRIWEIHSLLYFCIKDVHTDHAASHIGKAQGIVTMLRAVPHNAERSYCCVPVQSLIEHKVSQNDIVRGKDDQKVKDLTYSIAGVAHQHLETARSFKDKVPKAAIIALISTAATEYYLKALQQADFNLFDKRIQQRNHRLAMQLWLNKIRNRY